MWFAGANEAPVRRSRRRGGNSGVERAKAGIVRIFIAARDIRFQSNMRFERSLFESEPDIRRNRPGLNIAPAKGAKLIDEFEIIIPLAPSFPKFSFPQNSAIREQFPDRSGRGAALKPR